MHRSTCKPPPVCAQLLAQQQGVQRLLPDLGAVGVAQAGMHGQGPGPGGRQVGVGQGLLGQGGLGHGEGFVAWRIGRRAGRRAQADDGRRG